MRIKFNDLRRQHDSIRVGFHRVLDELLDDSEFILGSMLLEFEERFASFIGTSHAVGVSSGMQALEIGLKCLDLSPGDEVILPVNSFIATANAVTRCGLKPVFVDCNADDYLISCSSVKSAITNRSKVIIPVHLHGRVCDMDELSEIADDSGLLILEDAAQSVGAMYRGRQSGSFGQVGCFSFYPGKNLGALGDGGAVVSNSENIRDAVRLLRNYGSKVKYHHDLIAGNERLDSIQAGFLLLKLSFLDSKIQRRQSIASKYIKEINNQAIRLPIPDDSIRSSVWHNFVVRTRNRQHLASYLSTCGIETIVHYPLLITQQPCYSGYFNAKMYPNAVNNSLEIISIPIFPELTDSEVNYIITILNDYTT
jgi:dTDP-4-amino-4,6-dideoxygalactose transaminase